MTNQPTYAYDGNVVLRLTANGTYTPIGHMNDEHFASYAALALNAAATPDLGDTMPIELGGRPGSPPATQTGPDRCRACGSAVPAVRCYAGGYPCDDPGRFHERGAAR